MFLKAFVSSYRAVMPGMVMFRRRWSVGSDDLVLPALFLFILHCIWWVPVTVYIAVFLVFIYFFLNESLLFSPRLVVLSVVLFGLPYGSDQSCSVTLVDHGRGYLGILVSCLICESAIMWLSMRGSILYTQPREAVQYVIYIRLGIGRNSFSFQGKLCMSLYCLDVSHPFSSFCLRQAILLVELVYAVVGIAWLVQYYQPCSDVTAKNLALGEQEDPKKDIQGNAVLVCVTKIFTIFAGIVACNWLVILSVCITLMCTFDPTGRTFVKLKATRRRQRNLKTYTLR